MKAFNIHTVDTATLTSKELLKGVKKKIGFIPNVFTTIAESPNEVFREFSWEGKDATPAAHPKLESRTA